MAGFARSTGKPFWEAVEYLGRVERELGAGAAWFEIELASAMNREEAQKRDEALRHKAG